MLKQWHNNGIRQPRKPEKEKTYILTEIKEEIEEQPDGNILIKYSEVKTAPFERVNETAKILKITQMQELLNKINEIDKGV